MWFTPWGLVWLFPPPAGNAARPTGVPRPGVKYRPTEKLHSFHPGLGLFLGPYPATPPTLRPSETGIRNSSLGFGNEPSSARGPRAAEAKRGGNAAANSRLLSAAATKQVQQQEDASPPGGGPLRRPLLAAAPYGDPSRRSPFPTVAPYGNASGSPLFAGESPILSLRPSPLLSLKLGFLMHVTGSRSGMSSWFARLKLQASEYRFTWSHKYSWYWLRLQVAFFPLTLSLISARNFISYCWHLQCFMLNGVSLVRT
jgi:hypothetical protein